MARSQSHIWTDLEPLEPRLLLDGVPGAEPLADDLLVGAQGYSESSSPPWVTATPEAGAQPGPGVPGLDTDRSGREQDSSLEMWRFGPSGWELVGTDAAAQAGEVGQAAVTQPAWYYFTARVRYGDGTWTRVQSADRINFGAAGNLAPTIQITSPVTPAEVSLGQEFTVTWNAADGDGDPLSVYVWAFSWNTGWRQISGRLNGSDGRFLWDTGADWVQEGWYCFGAWVTDGSEWRATTSREWIQLVQGGGTDGGEDTPGSFSVAVVDSVLRISGTDFAETITVSMEDGRVKVQKGTSIWRPSGTITSIYVNAYGGDDVIRITHDITLGATIYAGDGNDKVYAAGMGGDVLYGGLGDDLLITVGGGTDTVRGQDGVDSFWADGADGIRDASSAELARTSVHTISSFYAAYTDDPGSPSYVPLEIAGQDLRDPTLTSTTYRYKDFTSRPLFVGTPSLSDVQQGYLGDCYFLASLASLTLSDPHLIQEMVTDLGDGTYAVRFYSGGQATYVRVDGQLPTYSATSQSLVYADKGRQGQIWVAIVEKAYAHFRYGENSYDSLNGGWMSTVYSEVANSWSSTYSVSNKTPEAMWDTLDQKLSQGHAVTLASVSSPQSPIVGGHAYTVQSVSNEGGELYVTVHNPWGVDGRSWDGNYNDGLMKLPMATFMACFSYVVSCAA